MQHWSRSRNRSRRPYKLDFLLLVSSRFLFWKRFQLQICAKIRTRDVSSLMSCRVMPVTSKCDGRSKFFRGYFWISIRFNFQWDEEDCSDIPAARERVNILWKQRDLMLKRLRKAQEQQTTTHNKHTQPKNFSVEDQVMLFIKNLRDARLKKKLSQKYTEFFAVVNLVESQSYRLRLSLIWCIHFVFHLSIKTLSQKWSYRFFLENDSRRERREVKSWRSTSSLKTHDLMRKYHKRTRYDFVIRKDKRSRLQEDWRHSDWVDFKYSSR